MSIPKFSNQAVEFLAGLHDKGAKIPVAGMTMDEARRQINSLLVGMTELTQATQSYKQGTGVNYFNPKEGAQHILKNNIPAEEIALYVAEIESVLDALPDKQRRQSHEFWVLAMNLQVIRFIAKRYFDDTPLPLFDTLGIGNVHAMVKSYEDNHVLVFQSGTKAFTNLFAKALIRIWTQFGAAFHGRPDLMTEERMVEILRGIDATPELTTMIHSYLFLGRPWGGARVQLDERLANLAGKLETAIDRFLIAHEYAHILYRHGFQKDIPRHHKEKEADRLAVILMLESMESENEDYVIPFCGALLIIALQEMIMKTIYLIKKENYNLLGYPSAFERCVNLLGACERQRVLTHLMEQTALGMLPMLAKLYSIIEPTLIETASKGRKLADIWR